VSDRYNSKIAKWIGKINHTASGHWAITITANTTLYSCAEALVNPNWRRHEECHKAQIRKEGFIFYVKYIYFNILFGYWDNPYEIEARKCC